jgi:integrase
MNKPTMPNIRSRKLPSGKTTYYLDYVDIRTGKRKRSTVGPRKRDAQEKAKEIYDEMMGAFIGAPEQRFFEMSVADVVESFFRSRQGRNADRTISRYRILARHFTDYMKSNFPTVLLANEVQRVYIEELLTSLQEAGQEPVTLNATLAFLKMLFKFAVDEGYVAANPAQRIVPFRETKKSEAVKFWTEDEVERILDKVKPWWRDAFEFLYQTGLRKGELMNLTWDDVQLKGNPPGITVQAKEDWATKTLKKRVVPLSARAIEILQRQKKSKKHKYVFTGAEGNKIHADRIYNALKQALKQLNLEGDVHQFRHTFASHLVMRGAGIETVSKLLGHSSIEMTMKYAHLAQDHLQTAVNLLTRKAEE